MRTLLIFALLTLSACKRAPELQRFGQVPPFELVSQTGQKTTLADLKGHVWVADAIFTNCQGPCPMMTSKMRGVAKEVESLADVRIVSLTVDPEHDSPEVLTAYAKEFQAKPAQWLFLTGAKEVLNQVSQDGLHLSKVDGSLEHGTRFALVDKTGEVRGYYRPFEKAEMKKLVSDIRDLAEQR